MQTPSAERWPVHPSGHNKLVFKRLTIRPERWRSFFEKSLWGKRIPFSHRPGTNHRAQKRLSPKWGKPRVGLPGFEPGKTGPESVVLPLHHIPIFLSKHPFWFWRCKDTAFYLIHKFLKLFFLIKILFFSICLLFRPSLSFLTVYHHSRLNITIKRFSN